MCRNISRGRCHYSLPMFAIIAPEAANVRWRADVGESKAGSDGQEKNPARDRPGFTAASMIATRENT